MRKIASLVLALTLALTAVPLTVSAAEDAKPLSDAELVNVLNANEKIRILSAQQTGVELWGDSGVEKLIDGDVFGTKLGGKTETNQENQTDNVTLTWETESAVPAYLAIYTGGDTRSYGYRNPNAFRLYGVTKVKNGEEEEVKEDLLLQSRDFMEAMSFRACGFAIDTDTAYTSYKMVLSTNRDLQLNEIELYTKEAKDIVAKDGLEEGRTDISKCADLARFQSSNGACGFIDGNLNFTVSVPRLIGATNSEQLLDKTQIYLNGEKAKFNNTYSGYTHCGMNADQGYFFGIVSAEYAKDEENDVVILIGDDYYVKTTYTPNSTAVAVTDSFAQYYEGLNSCIATVTFRRNPGYALGDTCKVQLHDDHTDREFTVTKVEGNTVTFECKEFSSGKTLLEFSKGTDKAFTIPIDEHIKTNTVTGYAQIRTNGDENFDIRVLTEAYEDYLKGYKSAVITAKFVDADGVERTITPDESYVKAFASVTAAGEKYVASDHCGLFGVVIKNIPYGTKSMSASVTFTTNDGKTQVVELGSIEFKFTVPTQLDKVTGTAYDASKITVYTNDKYDTVLTPNGESQDKLFDGTAYKMGGKDAPIYFKTNDSITISGLVFTIGNDTPTNTNRSFLNWKISGRDAEGNWVEVASSDKAIKTGEGLKGFENSSSVKIEDVGSEYKEAFAVYLAASFSEYKLEYTRQNGGYTQMAELTLYTK